MGMKVRHDWLCKFRLISTYPTGKNPTSFGLPKAAIGPASKKQASPACH
jgi:hypothetical protein